jgi:hypothetical protein
LTSEAVSHAKGKLNPVMEMNDSYQPDGKSHPAYYAWLPLTVPADVALSPFYGITLLTWVAVESVK